MKEVIKALLVLFLLTATTYEQGYKEINEISLVQSNYKTISRTICKLFPLCDEPEKVNK